MRYSGVIFERAGALTVGALTSWAMLMSLLGICASFKTPDNTTFYQLIFTLGLPLTGVISSYIYPRNFLERWWLVFYLAGFLLCIGVRNNTQKNLNNTNIWFSNILAFTNIFLNAFILYQYIQFEKSWNFILLFIWSFIVLLFGAIKAPFADTQKMSIISRINLSICLPILGIINCIINPTSFLAGWWLVFLIGSNILFTSMLDTQNYASQVSLKSTLIKISQALAMIFVIVLLGYVYSTKIAPIKTSDTQIFSRISNSSSSSPTQVFSPPVSPSPSPTQVFNTPDSPSPSPTQTFNIVDSPPSSILSPYPEKSPYKVIQNYYRNINSRQYETAWNTLSTELKDNTSYHPNGYDSYIRWWDKFRRIDIKKFDIISQVYREAIVDIDANYVKKSDGNLLDTKIRFFLVKNLNDFWLINKIQIISREKIKASKTSAEEFISEYYSLLNQRAYKTAWKKLTPIFQNKTGTYSDYVNWWNNVSRINIVQIKLIEQNNNAATIYAELQYVIKNENKVNSDESRFYLYWNNSQSHWQIAGKKAF